jgi:hypothetical protein
MTIKSHIVIAIKGRIFMAIKQVLFNGNELYHINWGLLMAMKKT